MQGPKQMVYVVDCFKCYIIGQGWLILVGCFCLALISSD